MEIRTVEKSAFERIGDTVKGFCLCLVIFAAGVLCRPIVAPIIRDVFAAPAVQAQPQQVQQVPFGQKGK